VLCIFIFLFCDESRKITFFQVLQSTPTIVLSVNQSAVVFGRYLIQTIQKKVKGHCFQPVMSVLAADTINYLQFLGQPVVSVVGTRESRQSGSPAWFMTAVSSLTAWKRQEERPSRDGRW
jgi:hypothetical protein